MRAITDVTRYIISDGNKDKSIIVKDVLFSLSPIYSLSQCSNVNSSWLSVLMTEAILLSVNKLRTCIKKKSIYCCWLYSDLCPKYWGKIKDMTRNTSVAISTLI